MFEQPEMQSHHWRQQELITAMPDQTEGELALEINVAEKICGVASLQP